MRFKLFMENNNDATYYYLNDAFEDRDARNFILLLIKAAKQEEENTLTTIWDKISKISDGQWMFLANTDKPKNKQELKDNLNTGFVGSEYSVYNRKVDKQVHSILFNIYKYCRVSNLPEKPLLLDIALATNYLSYCLRQSIPYVIKREAAKIIDNPEPYINALFHLFRNI